MKKGLLIGAAVAILAIGGAFYGYSWYCCATEAQATTTDVKKDDACCKAEESKAQTASMSMGCCEEKKEAKQ